MVDKSRKPRMGLLLLGSERFCALGKDTARGSYLERKQAEAAFMQKECGAIADVTFPGIVFGRADAARAIDAFTRAKVDYVLAIYLSWAEDYPWIQFLRDMPPVPILFAHRVRDAIGLHDTHDDDEFTEFLCCGGLVGMLEASGNNRSYQRPMLETTLGTFREVLARCESFGRAARARSLLRESTVGLLACYNEAMWSTYVHPYDLFHKVGPELTFLSVAELCDTIEEITDAEAEAVMREIAGRYEVLPDVDAAKFHASVKASMAMDRLAQRRGLDLLVLNDIDTMLFKKVGLRPGFYPVPGACGAITVPEGDLGGGIAAYALHLLTGDHVHFIEPFHIDLPGDTFAAGHAGPNDYTDPRGSTKISRDVRFAKSPWKHAGAPFAWHVFGEGRKTMLHCSQRDGRFQFVLAAVDCLPTEHFLATYSHGLFRAVGQSNRELFDKLLRIGVTQHYAIVHGDCLQAVEDLSGLLQFTLHRV